MQRWVVKFSDLKTVDVLKEMGIVSYIPTYYQQLKTVFIKTDMDKEDILKIEGVESIREERVGKLHR